MTELVLMLDPIKSDVVSALKIKNLLWDNGIMVSGILLNDGDEGEVFSPELLEDMMQLRVLGSLKKR
ncbi:hypothetical protein KKA03_05310 [archaeon]|nr:hypothetical protein [archaeon]